MEYNFPMPNLI